MFKITSDNSQFRLRPRESYSSDDARRWAFFALVIYENRKNFRLSSHLSEKFAKIKKELDETGELDEMLDWFVSFLEHRVDGECKKQLRHLYSLCGDTNSAEG